MAVIRRTPSPARHLVWGIWSLSIGALTRLRRAQSSGLGLPCRRLLALAERGPEPAPVRAAQHIERDWAADLLRIKEAHQVISAGDRRAVDGEQNIAGQEPRVLGEAPGLAGAH